MNENENKDLIFEDDERDIASEYSEETNMEDYTEIEPITQDVDFESEPHQEISIETEISDTASQSNEESGETAFVEPDNSTEYVPPTYSAPSVEPKKSEPHYVTRGALVIALILTMLLSSVLGAFVATRFIGDTSDTSTSNGQDSALTIAEATDSELSVAEVVAKAEDAVVEITVSAETQNIFGQTQLTEGAGSGVIVTSDGYIVTNYHVIEGASSITVTLHNGEQYNATLIGSDSDNDISVIKISADNLTVAELGDSSEVNVGDIAIAIGNPLGQLGGTATTGIISALDRQLTIDGRTLTLMQTDAAINPGNSGGGLFDGSGNLIGIVDAKSSGTGIEGLGFAIPINSVKDTINELITTGKVSGKPIVGVVIQDVSEENAQYYGLEAAGVYIAQVSGENAQKAGFQVGDRVISIEGQEVSSASDFVSIVRQNEVGDTISVVVSRNGQQIEIKTVLEESVQVDE